MHAYKNANGSVPAFQVQCVLPSWPMDHTLFSGSKTNIFLVPFFCFLFVVWQQVAEDAESIGKFILHANRKCSHSTSSTIGKHNLVLHQVHFLCPRVGGKWSMVTLGVQTVDFQQLSQGACNQIAERKHEDAWLSKGVVYKNYTAKDKQGVTGLL